MKISQRVRAALITSALVSATSACLVPRTAAAADSASVSNSAPTVPPIGEVAFQTLGLGTQSGCTRAAKMLITNGKEWRRVWTMHNANSKSAPLPIVDFSRQAVVVLLGGQNKNASIQINQIVRAPSQVVVFFDNLMVKDDGEKSATTSTSATSASGAFHFALIEKPQAPLRFQDLSDPECATCVLKPGE